MSHGLLRRNAGWTLDCGVTCKGLVAIKFGSRENRASSLYRHQTYEVKLLLYHRLLHTNLCHCGIIHTKKVGVQVLERQLYPHAVLSFSYRRRRQGLYIFNGSFSLNAKLLLEGEDGPAFEDRLAL